MGRALLMAQPSALIPLIPLLLLSPMATAQRQVSWSRATLNSNGPTNGRASMAYTSQALANLPGGQLADVLWMYGGMSTAQPVNYSAELWTYTASTSGWELIYGLPNAPIPLAGASLCTVGTTLFLFGGFNLDGAAYDYMWQFNTATRAWSLVTLAGTWPAARRYHAMACTSTEVFVHGGLDGSEVNLADINVLTNLNAAGMAWSSPVPAGVTPSARKRHTLTNAANGKLYLFGGSDSSGTMLNDAYSLDATSPYTWTALAASGDQPPGREGHVAVVLNQKLYIFGGMDASQKLNDVYTLDLASLVWHAPRASTEMPLARWMPMGGLLNGNLYVYGGVGANNNLLTDVWSMSRYCQGHVSLSGTSATFYSGEGLYQPSSECSWSIVPTEKHRQVRLYFSAFAFQEGHDYLRVYDGPTAEAPQLAVLTGAGRPLPIVSTNGTLFVVMTTDASINDAGFTAHYFSECSSGFIPGGAASPASRDYCSPCPSGHFSASPGLLACTACPSHQYQSELGATACVDCPAGARGAASGTARVEDCLCYEGFHAPNGTGTACVACPVGGSCPGKGEPAVARAGFCRVDFNDSAKTEVGFFAPCCDPEACPGGEGKKATCDDSTPGLYGEVGAEECVQLRILTLTPTHFAYTLGAFLGCMLCCFAAGCCQGWRFGTRAALRDYVERIQMATNGPQVGQYTAALSGELDEAEADGQGTALDARMEQAAANLMAATAVQQKPQSASSSRARIRPARIAAVDGAGGVGGGGGEVGVALVDLEEVQREEEEARLMGRSSRNGGCDATGGATAMSLATLRGEEGEFMAPSTAGDRDASGRGGGTPSETSFRGEMPPPTPPKAGGGGCGGARGGAAPANGNGGANGHSGIEGGGEYVGTCLVQMPDSDGRWQPVQISASMCGSPHGSAHPSLAPSETTLGGRSRRRMGAGSFRNDDACSIPETEEEHRGGWER